MGGESQSNAAAPGSAFSCIQQAAQRKEERDRASSLAHIERCNAIAREHGMRPFPAGWSVIGAGQIGSVEDDPQSNIQAECVRAINLSVQLKEAQDHESYSIFIEEINNIVLE